MGKQTFRLVLLSILFLFTGCATLADPGPDMVSFRSTPPGAKVSIDGVVVGKTPCKGEVERDREKGNIVFEKDGFPRVKFTVPREFNDSFLGNLIAPGVTGMIIDYYYANHRRARSVVEIDLKTGELIERSPRGGIPPPKQP